MKSFFKILLFLFFIKNTVAQDLTNIVYLELKDGRVVIEMKPDYASEHVKLSLIHISEPTRPY